MPEVTRAMARPRRSGDAMATATPMAVGIKRPAPSAITVREASSIWKAAGDDREQVSGDEAAQRPAARDADRLSFPECDTVVSA
jgi:hypothetical protein